MLIFGITELQSKPAILKQNDIIEIEDKRKNIKLGYFISSKYEDELKPILEKINKRKKIEKLKKLKKHQDLEFLEAGIDDDI